MFQNKGPHVQYMRIMCIRMYGGSVPSSSCRLCSSNVRNVVKKVCVCHYVKDMGLRILNLKSGVQNSWWLLRYAVICISNVGPSIVCHIFQNVWVLAHVEDMGVEISNLSSEVPNALRLLR